MGTPTRASWKHFKKTGKVFVDSSEWCGCPDGRRIQDIVRFKPTVIGEETLRAGHPRPGGFRCLGIIASKL
eukprot:2249651-Karenia_brevis.AAC.1